MAEDAIVIRRDGEDLVLTRELPLLPLRDVVVFPYKRCVLTAPVTIRSIRRVIFAVVENEFQLVGRPYD